MKTLTKYIKNNKFNYIFIKKNYLTQEVNNVLNKYNLTLQELCYRIKNNIPLDEVFKCNYCGKKIVLRKKDKYYKKFCNCTCANSYRNKSQEFKNKRKQTWLNKYGVDFPVKLQTTQDKRKRTCMEKYGVNSPVKSKEVHNKIEATCLKKYGVKHYAQTKEYRNFVKANHNKLVEKAKVTCLKKYGVEHYSKTQEYKDKMKHYNTVIQQKIYDTKKVNNSFTKSKQEEKVYKLLLTKFTKEDIERQYKSKLYPFNCDFYIKSIDLYIEYNGNWTHGPELFNIDNVEHLKLLNYWKNKINELNFKGKKKDYFKIAIYVWTDLDVRKLKAFKDNNLNYKIFWNIKEVEDWISKI